MMIGFDVAPVAPNARLLTTKSGSTESSQSFVPAWMMDESGEDMEISLGRFTQMRNRVSDH